MKVNNPNYLNGLSSSASEIDRSVDGFIRKTNDLQYITNKIAISNKIAVVGDSISHGAYSTDIKNKSYTNLLKNKLNQKFNSLNYGFETISASNTAGLWNSTMIHGCYSVGTASVPADTNTNSLNGNEKWGVVSTQFFFNIKDLKSQKKFRINLIKHISIDCTYSIYVNNVLAITESISASGTFNETTTSSILDLVDAGNNNCIIKLVITSGGMGVFGCTYYNNEYDFLLNNYSHSGRKSSYVKEEVVKKLMSDNSVVFWNLGHNDAGSVDLTQFNQVMEWVYTYALVHNTVVIFTDFLWTHSLTHAVRLKNKEISTRLGKQSWYIEIPKTLTIDGTVPTSSYLITTLGAWTDVSHPNDKGHRVISSQISLSLNL